MPDTLDNDDRGRQAIRLPPHQWVDVPLRVQVRRYGIFRKIIAFITRRELKKYTSTQVERVHMPGCLRCLLEKKFAERRKRDGSKTNTSNRN